MLGAIIGDIAAAHEKNKHQVGTPDRQTKVTSSHDLST